MGQLREAAARGWILDVLCPSGDGEGAGGPARARRGAAGNRGKHGPGGARASALEPVPWRRGGARDRRGLSHGADQDTGRGCNGEWERQGYAGGM